LTDGWFALPVLVAALLVFMQLPMGRKKSFLA
jgi:hypothetical protein